MSPSKQLLDTIWAHLLSKGYDVYDYLPAQDVSYPFVHLGDTFDDDNVRIKGLLRHQVSQRIDIYHTLKNRKELTEMYEYIKSYLRSLKETNDYTITANIATSFIGKDESTSTTYHRGHIEVDFLMTRKLGGNKHGRNARR